jgi:hypothetical protein
MGRFDGYLHIPSMRNIAKSDGISIDLIENQLQADHVNLLESISYELKLFSDEEREALSFILLDSLVNASTLQQPLTTLKTSYPAALIDCFHQINKLGKFLNNANLIKLFAFFLKSKSGKEFLANLLQKVNDEGIYFDKTALITEHFIPFQECEKEYLKGEPFFQDWLLKTLPEVDPKLFQDKRFTNNYLLVIDRLHKDVDLESILNAVIEEEKSYTQYLDALTTNKLINLYRGKYFPDALIKAQKENIEFQNISFFDSDPQKQREIIETTNKTAILNLEMIARDEIAKLHAIQIHESQGYCYGKVIALMAPLSNSPLAAFFHVLSTPFKRRFGLHALLHHITNHSEQFPALSKRILEEGVEVLQQALGWGDVQIILPHDENKALQDAYAFFREPVGIKCYMVETQCPELDKFFSQMTLEAKKNCLREIAAGKILSNVPKAELKKAGEIYHLPIQYIPEPVLHLYGLKSAGKPPPLKMITELSKDLRQMSDQKKSGDLGIYSHESGHALLISFDPRPEFVNPAVIDPITLEPIVFIFDDKEKMIAHLLIHLSKKYPSYFYYGIETFEKVMPKKKPLGDPLQK